MRTAYVSVNVASVWTKPNLTRDIDIPAILNPVDMPKWLSTMTHEDKVWLIDQDILQTQVLFGGQVFILEEQEGWSRVLVTEQLTPKNEQGYPGWIPSTQLSFDQRFDDLFHQAPSVWVTVPKAVLHDEQDQLCLSYLTRLPLVREEQNHVIVYLPTGGEGRLATTDITINRTPHQAETPFIQAKYPMLQKRGGPEIVESGKQFLDLPYLWSGMSSFGYDCSGFSHSMHKANGVLIPRDASAQFYYGKEHGLHVDKEHLQPGDLVYFMNGKGQIYHVGIYVGGGNFLHASNSKKVVMIQPLTEGKYGEQFCGAIRFY